MIRLVMTGLVVMAWMVPARADAKPKAAPSKNKEAACEGCCCGEDSQTAQRVFELRTYYLNEGKLADLNKRFRDHTCRLLKQHGAELNRFEAPDDRCRRSEQRSAFPSWSEQFQQKARG